MNDKEICKLYEGGKSSIELSKLYSIPKHIILKCLHKHNIKMRSKKEALSKYVRWNTCVICGKFFRPKESWLSTNSNNRKTCSKECNSKLLSLINTKETGNSQAYYQRRRRLFKKDKCEMCGITNIRMDTHHIDRDHFNNTEENLMVLCVHCHAKLHYEQDDRELRGYK